MKNLSTVLILLVSAALICAAFVFVFRPIQINRENSIVLTDTVLKVGKGAQGNIIIMLYKGDGTLFINHGLEKGINLDTLKKQILYQPVTISYLKPGRLNGISPIADTRHITELKTGEQLIYSELR